MKRAIFLMNLLVLCSLLSAQPSHTIVTRFLHQLQAYPQEKTYIHTDGSDYACGDRVWMKVYVVNALSHETTNESRYVYVELISPEGVMLSRVKLLSRDGVYAGYVDLPGTGISGRYRLRSYTDLMTNVTNYESNKVIYVRGTSGTAAATQAITAGTEVQGTDQLAYVKEKDRIRVLTKDAEQPCYLIAHCRAYPFYIGEISSRRPVVLMADSIPQGVISLLLIDGEMNILAERLFFSDNGKEQCRLDITSEGFSPTAQDTLLVRLQIPDLRADERADISVSIRKLTRSPQHKPSSIVAQLLLASDVTGGMDEAEQLYGQTARIDSLLGWKRWERYDMQKMLHGQTVHPSIGRESSSQLSGRVRSLVLKKPVHHATVNLISPQVGIYARATTDQNGNFTFPEMDYPEHTEYILHALTAKGSDRVELLMDEKDYPDDAHPARQYPDELFDVMPDDTLSGFQRDAIVLDKVEVTAEKRNSASRGDTYAQLADFSFGLKEIDEMDATCLHEVIRRIPSVFIRENKCYIRAASSINGDHPAAIVIDGVFVDSDYDLDIIQMSDVARIDVFKTGTTVIWGARGGSGVVSITTKEGSYNAGEAAERMSLKKISPLGYQPYASFSRQLGSRKTLYWNPNVTSHTLRMGVQKDVDRCLVVVEGVTTEGRLIHEEKEIVLP